MKISGFTMVKNAQKLYYPIKQAIKSVLPICDEFIVALGDCDEDDNTLDEIKSIKSDKIKIIHTVWDIEKYKNGTENAHQTNIAKENCSGDWLIYLQADELIHEKYLNEIKDNCKKYLNTEKVEGFLFKYKHFWGDFYHFIDSHGWYKKEIRIIRNKKDIYSFASAQSFRRIPNFDGISYRDKKNTFKLKVIEIDAYIYHYGWVRPPKLMVKKSKALATIHKGKQKAEKIFDKKNFFNYGAMKKLNKFKGTHPKVMNEWIKKFDWEDKLNYTDNNIKLNRRKFKHERLKYKIINFIEKKFLKGNTIKKKNWILLSPKKLKK